MNNEYDEAAGTSGESSGNRAIKVYSFRNEIGGGPGSHLGCPCPIDGPSSRILVDGGGEAVGYIDDDGKKILYEKDRV